MSTEPPKAVPKPEIRIAGVLLAAGRSTRMDSTHMGQSKQLALLGGAPLCRHAALALAGAGFASLLAVIPPGQTGERIQAALADLGFDFVVNMDPARGLASSFRTAAQALGPEADAAQFALADMPLVTPATHRAVQAEFRRYGAPIVVTRYLQEAAVIAPPTLFRADLLPHLAALPNVDQGPRELVHRFSGQVTVVERSAIELVDIDTPEQLTAVQKHFK